MDNLLPVKPVKPANFATPYGLQPPQAQLSDSGSTVIPLTIVGASHSTNSLQVEVNLNHRYEHELQIGEYAPIGNTIDPQAVIACESYLSALALATRCDYWSTLVVACFEPENIYPVLSAFYRHWPYHYFEAAPDTRDKSLCKGTLYPPGDLTWLDLHIWEVESRWTT